MKLLLHDMKIRRLLQKDFDPVVHRSRVANWTLFFYPNFHLKDYLPFAIHEQILVWKSKDKVFKSWMKYLSRNNYYLSGTIHLRRRHFLEGRGQKFAKIADR